MDDEREVVVFRATGCLWGALVSVGLLVLGTVVADLFGTFRRVSDAYDVTDREGLVLLLGLSAVSVVSWRVFARPRLEVRGRAVTVVNPLRTYRLDRRVIREVSSGPYLVLRLPDRSIHVLAVEEPNLEVLLAPGRRAAGVVEAVEHVGGEPVGQALEVRVAWTRPSWAEVVLLTSWCAYLGATVALR